MYYKDMTIGELTRTGTQKRHTNKVKIFKCHPHIIFFISGDRLYITASFSLSFFHFVLPSLPDNEVKRLFCANKRVLFV